MECKITVSKTRGSDKRGFIYRYFLESKEFGNFITFGIDLSNEDVIAEFEEFLEKSED